MGVLIKLPRITILAAGSQGDVQPYLALAVGLRHAGLCVRLAANCNFAELAASYGVDFFPIQVDSQSYTRSQPVQDWLESRSPLALVRGTYRVIRPVVGQMLADCWEASQDAEAIIYHSYTLPFGYYIARRLGVPSYPASIYPMPTRAHPALPVSSRIRLGGNFNLLSHWVSDLVAWSMFFPAAKSFLNGELQVRRASPSWLLHKERHSVLCCYSPVVLPPPVDLPENVRITGYWFLDPPPVWQPDPRLEDFIHAGPPPVYIGFGSMGNPAKNQATTELVLAALERSGHRAVLSAGWSGLGQGRCLPEKSIVAKNTPHTWLFPQMAAIVHHGGVGTTGAGLRAGVPNVIIPHFADQRFWGWRVAELGAGPQPIPREELTAAILAQVLCQALEDAHMRARATSLGEQIAAQDGVAVAIDIIRRETNVSDRGL